MLIILNKKEKEKFVKIEVSIRISFEAFRILISQNISVSNRKIVTTKSFLIKVKNSSTLKTCIYVAT